MIAERYSRYDVFIWTDPSAGVEVRASGCSPLRSSMEVIVSPADLMIARFMRFSSSRTFPFHW